MLLERRIRKLEDHFDSGGCSTCRGRGRVRVLLVSEGEEPDYASAECPECGKMCGYLKVVRLIDDEDPDTEDDQEPSGNG